MTENGTCRYDEIPFRLMFKTCPVAVTLIGLVPDAGEKDMIEFGDSSPAGPSATGANVCR